jgi:hypothetical protein
MRAVRVPPGSDRCVPEFGVCQGQRVPQVVVDQGQLKPTIRGCDGTFRAKVRRMIPHDGNRTPPPAARRWRRSSSSAPPTPSSIRCAYVSTGGALWASPCDGSARCAGALRRAAHRGPDGPGGGVVRGDARRVAAPRGQSRRQMNVHSPARDPQLLSTDARAAVTIRPMLQKVGASATHDFESRMSIDERRVATAARGMGVSAAQVGAE